MTAKRLGNFLLIIGIMMITWNGYQWWKGSQSVFPYTEKAEATSVNKQDTKTSPENYKKGQEVATLAIPTLEQKFEIFWGTNKDTLAKGVGMYISQWTVTPDKVGHVVLSGHRDTVFGNLGELEKGQRLYVNYQGVKYEYKIKKIWVTNANDYSVIVKKDKPTLTLTTCYPFDYIGDAPKRYIVQSTLKQVSVNK